MVPWDAIVRFSKSLVTRLSLNPERRVSATKGKLPMDRLNRSSRTPRTRVVYFTIHGSAKKFENRRRRSIPGSGRSALLYWVHFGKSEGCCTCSLMSSRANREGDLSISKRKKKISEAEIKGAERHEKIAADRSKFSWSSLAEESKALDGSIHKKGRKRRT
jgi:hypothetical protein